MLKALNADIISIIMFLKITNLIFWLSKLLSVHESFELIIKQDEPDCFPISLSFTLRLRTNAVGL